MRIIMKNWIIYGGGNNNNNNNEINYSSTKRIVGTWFNIEPIYQKMNLCSSSFTTVYNSDNTQNIALTDKIPTNGYLYINANITNSIKIIIILGIFQVIIDHYQII